MQRVYRSVVVAGCAAAIFVLGACSDSKPKAADSSDAASSPASSSASSDSTSAAATGPTVTEWPLEQSPTSLGAKSQPTAATCNLLSGAQLQRALGVSFSSANPGDASCQYNGDDNSRIKLSAAPITGDTQEQLQLSEGRCDAGTVQPINIADGAYTCRVTGVPVGGVAANGTLLRFVFIELGSITADKGEQGFAELLNDLA